MAALSGADRISVGAEFQQERSLARDVFGGLTKADIQATVVAIDDWVVANAAAFNSTIPQPARGALTAPQKALLFEMVLRRRYQTGA
jgi:hypothetical protein